MTTGRVRFAVPACLGLLLALAFFLPACSGTAERSLPSSAASGTDPASPDSYVGEYTEERDSTAVLLLRPDRSFFLFVPEYDQSMSHGGYYTVEGPDITLAGDLGPVGSLTANGDRLTSQDGRYVFIRNP